MENLGYYNGKYDLLENMTVPMNDRACYFGDGIFEVAYCRNYKIYALDEHMDRMFESADALGFNVPYTKDELSAILYDLIKKVDSHEQHIYWQLSRGTQTRDHAPAEGLTANLWVMLRPMRIKDTYAPMKLITLDDTRFFHCNMKTLNSIPTVLASAKTVAAGADEAVLHRGGRVTECAHSNVSIIKDGCLVTAPADNLILPGVARAHLLAMCERFGIQVREEPYTLNDLMSADEVIVTASSMLCRPAREIDGKPVGGKAPELLKMLQDALVKDFLDKTEA
jgi:D-alanine transaminase